MKGRKRIKKMLNISRVDQRRRNQHGWLVRVMRNKFMHQKFFSDSVFGNKLSSLLAAQKYRDDLLRRYPKPERGNMFNRKSSRNTSGHAGLSRTGSYKNGRYYQVWQASWVTPDGKKVTRKFGFSEMGRNEREAKRLAIRARREAIASM